MKKLDVLDMGAAVVRNPEALRFAADLYASGCTYEQSTIRAYRRFCRRKILWKK